MSNDVKNLFRVMGGVAFGMLFMMLYQYENPPEYTIDWKEVGTITSTEVRENVFYKIKTDKGEFTSIDFEAEKHLKGFTPGKKLYKFYVAKQIKWPGMKNRDIGEVQLQYGCAGCGHVMEGNTMVHGVIARWDND